MSPVRPPSADPGPTRATRLLRLAASLLVVGLLVWFGNSWLRSRRFERELALARADLDAGKPAPALGRLRSLADLRPDRAEVLLELARAQLATGKLVDALATWSAIPRSAPERPVALARAGNAAVEGGRFHQAESLLLDALQIEGPHRNDAATSLGRLYRYQGRLAEVQALLRTIWSWLPPTARTFEMIREHAMIEFDPVPVEAIRAVLERALKSAPEDPGLALAWANLETRLGRLDEAGRWLERASEPEPDRLPLLRARLERATAGNDPRTAVELIGKLRGDSLTPAERADLRAWFAASSRDVRAEQQRLEERSNEPPSSTAALDRLASLALRLGQAEQAAGFRRRKAQLDDTLQRYRALLRAEPSQRDLPALAAAARTLGRRFEADAFQALNDPSVRPEPESSSPTTARLIDLIPEAQAAGGISDVVRESGNSPIVFEDVAKRSGVDFTFQNGESAIRQLPETMSGGLGMLDYDGDGWLDLYLVQGGSFPPAQGDPGGDRLFRNKKDGTFEDMSDALNLKQLTPGYGHGIAVGDYDNDGDPDLFLTRWRSYILLRNDTYKFTDVTAVSGLGGSRDWPTSAAWADLDSDGDLDLYVCHYLEWDSNSPRPCRNEATRSYTYCDPRVCRAVPDRLFRNDAGRFVDVSESSGIAAADRDGRGLGVVAADLDLDGRTDLFVANDGTANFFFRNLGGLQFEEVAHVSGLAGNAEGGYQAGMGIACGDADGDGLPDLLVTNFYGEGSTFQQNLGGGQFADRSAATGVSAATRYLLGFGTAFADLDNDGRLDLATANGHVNDFRPLFPYRMPAQVLRGTASGRFHDASRSAGAAIEAPRLGRALATGDVDNDGRTDILIQSLNEPVALLSNQTEAGHVIQLELVGTKSNRDAVGAVVTIEAAGVRQVRFRTGGGSYLTAADPRLHIGLGPAEKADRIAIRWPSGATSEFRDVAAGRRYRATEEHSHLSTR